MSAIAVCYATSPVVGDCRLISAPLWSCGLNLPYRAVPSSLGLARLVSFAGVFIGRVRPCAPLRSRVSRGVPRPARTPGVGPPPLPPSSPRSLRSRPAGSGYALGESGSLRRGLPPKSRLRSPLRLPAADLLRFRRFRSSSPRVPLAAVSLLSRCAPCILLVLLTWWRFPDALRLSPLSLRRQPLSSTFPTLVVSLAGAPQISRSLRLRCAFGAPPSAFTIA